MADQNSLIEQMLEHLVNDETQKAEEIFHEYVVAKSREIYESLIEDEMNDDEDENENEEFEDIALERDDEMDLDSDDPTDSLAGELDYDSEGEEEDDKSEEELFQDLNDIVDELQARFDAMSDNDMNNDEMDDTDINNSDDIKDSFEQELTTVREYVEKVPSGHGAEKKGTAEKADNTKSVIDNMKNDMGGTTANILSGRNGATGTETGALKGNGLLKGSPKEDNAGNINVPGGKAGNAFNKKEPGHGAEKKGSGESADNKQSLFRGRR